jgi:hypothetical protein
MSDAGDMTDKKASDVRPEEGALSVLLQHLSKAEALMTDFDGNYPEIAKEISAFSQEMPAVVDELVREGKEPELRSLESRMQALQEECSRRREETQTELLKFRRSARGIHSYKMNDGHRWG